MSNKPVQISEHCWKHTNKYGHVFYRKTSDPYSQLHRVDGPAIECSNGDKHWYINGKLHRTDGPAIEWADGSEFWYKNGKRHRENGPAIEWSNGNKCWYINNKRHRTDGPAIEWSNGDKEWYLHGKLIVVRSQEEFLKYLKTHKHS